MSRRASDLGYHVSDSDIETLARLVGPHRAIPRPPPRPDPRMDYVMRLTAGCPCDPCLQRRTCAEECVLFDAWVRACDRGNLSRRHVTR
jgi:hypothetical protein